MSFLSSSTVVLWIALFGFAIIYTFRQRKVSGILLCFLVNLFLYHGLNELIFVIGGVEVTERVNSQYGFESVALALSGFLMGTIAVLFATRSMKPVVPPSPAIARRTQFINLRFANYCFVMGGIIFMLVWIGQAVIGFSLAGSIASCGNTLLIAAMMIRFLTFSDEGRHGIAWLQLLPAMLLPVITTVFGGFIGFGAIAVSSVMMFLVFQARTRWLILLVPIIVYVALSVWVSYLPIRQQLRESIGFESTVRERADLITEQVVMNFTWLNPYELTTVSRLDRFDQNWLIGLARHRVESGQVEMLYGETYLNILIGPIPRILWPNKPSLTGGSRLASQFTGREFYGDTTVGIGQIMEAYINFGFTGLFIIFLLIGALITWLDVSANRAMEARRADLFATFFVLAQQLMSILEFAAAIVTAMVASLLVTWLLKKLIYEPMILSFGPMTPRQ